MVEAKRVAVYDPKAERLLFDALRQRARGRTELVKLTRADAVALTGLPSEQAEPALKALVKSYRSHLAVTEAGELVYEFDPHFERRDQVPLAERVRKLAELGWRGFKFLFKIWIVVTLIVYVIAFVAMMISLMFAGKGNDRNDRRGGGGGGLFWLWYLMMPDLAPRGYYGGYGDYDDWGRPIRRAAPQKPRKRFYQAVFDYVFGPKGAPLDPRESDKRLIAFLRDHKGRVTASELAGLTGLSLDEADEELTRLVVEYDGEAQVAEDGTLVYVFESLLTSAEQAGTHWNWAWDRSEPAEPLTGNTTGANVAITGFNAFNLLASMTIGPAFLMRVHLVGDPVATFFVTLFPLIFSLIFFLVPAGRLVAARRRARRRRARELRRELQREIFTRATSADAKLDPEAMVKQVAERTGQPAEKARKALDKLLADLDGDVTTDEAGKMLYTFPRLADERKAAEAARARAKAPELGEVVFSSEDEAKI